MIQIKIYGLGGQGVVTAAKILVEAVVLHELRYAKSLPAYGHERRGAPIYTDVMISDEVILMNSFVYQPDIVMLFDPSVIDKGIDICSGCHSETQLVANLPPNFSEPHTLEPAASSRTIANLKCFRQVFQVNATQIALDTLNKNIPNSAMLGSLARSGVVKLGPVLSALDHVFGEKAGALNTRAAREAYESTQIL